MWPLNVSRELSSKTGIDYSFPFIFFMDIKDITIFINIIVYLLMNKIKKSHKVNQFKRFTYYNDNCYIDYYININII